MSTVYVIYHLLLNRGTPPEPEVGARWHPADPDYPELADVVYLTVEATAGRLTLSGTPAQLTSLLDRLHGELAALLTTPSDQAGRGDASDPAPQPAPAS